MSYFNEALDSKKRQLQIKKAVEILSLFQFDYIVVRGFSGVAMGSVIAHILNKDLIILRKTRSDNHSDHLVEDPHRDNKYKKHNCKYLIVDDFVCSGDTVKNILEEMKEYSKGEAECIGFWGYTTHWESKSKNWDDSFYKSIQNVFKELNIENINLLQTFPEDF